MRKYLLAAVAALALGGSAHANIIANARNPWVLIGLNWANGIGLEGRSDVAQDAGIGKPGVMPMFNTRTECQDALQAILTRYRGVSHAGGGGGYYVCALTSAFAIPE